MKTCEPRRLPSPRTPALLLLAPLALLTWVLLGILLAPPAGADHPVTPPSGLSVSPGPVGSTPTPSWSFDVEAGDTATCTLRGPAGVLQAADCTSPFVPASPLPADGSYELEVRSTRPDVLEPDPLDPAQSLLHLGGTSESATSTYLLDSTPPSPPAVPGADTRGTDRTLTWSFTQTGDGTGFRCRLLRNGVGPGEPTACTSNYTVTVTEDGAYQLQVAAVDAVGNLSAVTSGPVRTVDTTGPAAPGVTLPVAGGSTASATWVVTAGETGTTSECRLTRTADGSTSEVFGWRPCADHTVDLPAGEGVYVLTVRLVDDLGNVGSPTTGPGYTLDSTAPDQPTVAGSRSGTDNERAVGYTFTGEGTAICLLYRGTSLVQTWTGCQAPQPFAVTLPAVDGDYALQVTFTDAYGNVGPPGTSGTYTLDVTPPPTPLVRSDRSGTDNEQVVTYSFSGEGTATCRLTRDGAAVGAATTCAGPWVVTLPAVDGSYVLHVSLTDAYGNVGDAGASPAYLLDLTPPVAPVVHGPSGSGNARTVSWTFSGEGTATCTLLLAGAAHSAPVGCASSHTVSLPSDGAWSLRVSFTDAVGNPGAAGTSATYLLDTVPPAAPRLSGASGPSQDRAPSWTVRTDAGSTAQCRLVRGSTAVGDWTSCLASFVADLTGLPDGAYAVQARATDAAGNIGATSTSGQYVLDTTPPAAVTVRGPTGPSQLPTARFTWTGESGARAECRLSRDGTAVGGWAPCASGFTPTLDGDGTWTLAVRLTDAAGNVSAPATSSGYVLDTTAPATPVVTPPQTPGRDLAPTWGAVVEGGSSAECRLTRPDGTTTGWRSCALPHVTLLDGQNGSYVLQVRVTDAAGNVSAVGRGTYVLDTVAPVAAVVVPPGSPDRSRTPTISFTVEPAATTMCRLTSGATIVQDYTACTSPASLDLTGLPDGTYTLTVRVSDAAGNLGPAAAGTYVLDTTAPGAPVLTLAPATPAPTRSVTWAFRHELGGTLVCRLTLPGGAVRDLGSCASPLTVDLTGSPDGTYTLTVRVVDQAGNVGAPLLTSYVLDGGAPAAAVVTGPRTPGSTRTPSWTFTVGAMECRLTRDGTVVGDWSACATGSYTADLHGRPDGTYALAVRAVGSTSAVVSSYVLDTTAPALATVVAPPTPSTNRSPVWSVASPEIGATAQCRLRLFSTELRGWQPCAVTAAGALVGFELDRGDGTYTLDVRLTDAAGNIGPTASSSYVLDTAAPVAAIGIAGPPATGKDPHPVWLLSTSEDADLQCRLTSAAGVVSDWTTCSGSYTRDLTDLPDGSYTLTVRAVSAAGTPGREESSSYLLWRTRPSGPEALALVGTTPGPHRNPAWTFTLPQGTTGLCQLVRGPETLFHGPCSSGFSYDLSRATDGSYTLHVVAVDEAGNGSVRQSSTYELRTVPPARPVLTAEPGRGGSTLTPQWRFTVGYGATAQCRLLYSGVATEDWLDCADVYTAFLTGRPDGRYTFEVRARDSAGNTSAPSTSSYLLDRDAVPVVTFTATPPTPGDASYAAWRFSAPEGTTTECRLVAPDQTTAWAPCTGGFIEPVAGRANGDYVLNVQVVAADGRRGAVATSTYHYDTEPPLPPEFTEGPDAAGRTPDPQWFWDAAAGERIQCRLTGTGGAVLSGWADCTSPFAPDLTEHGPGTYTLEIRRVDAAGNPSDATSRSYVLDTTSPARPVLRGPMARDGIVTWLLDLPPDAEGAWCRVTRDLVLVEEGSCSTRYQLDLTGRPDGTYTLTVSFYDAAGNESPPAIGRYVLDTSTRPIRVDPPAAPKPPPAPGTGAGAPGPGRGGTAPLVDAPSAYSPVPEVPTGTDEDVAPRGPAGQPGFGRESTVAAADPDRTERSSSRDRGEGEIDAGLIRDVFVGTIERPTLPLALLVIVVLFLLAQNRIDRRDPKLAAAPVEPEPELDFTVFIRRPGEAFQ